MGDRRSQKKAKPTRASTVEPVSRKHDTIPKTVWEAHEGGAEWVVDDWPLPPEMAAKLDLKIAMLRAAEVDATGRVQLPHNLLAGPKIHGHSHIYKMRVQGSMALRPMLCLGPADTSSEWTVLCRCSKKDNDTGAEKDAAALAAMRRAEIVAGTRKRRIYE